MYGKKVTLVVSLPVDGEDGEGTLEELSGGPGDLTPGLPQIPA